MFRACENLREILLVQVRPQHEQPSEVKLPRGERIQQCRKAPHQAGRRDSTKRLVLREAKLVDAIRVEARASADPMDAARFHLAEVREQLREQLVRPPHETACTSKQLGV